MTADRDKGGRVRPARRGVTGDEPTMRRPDPVAIDFDCGPFADDVRAALAAGDPPDDAECGALVDGARALWLLGHATRALDCLRRVAARGRPIEPFRASLALRARILVAQGRFAAALESIEPLDDRALDPLRARALAALGRVDEARGLARAAIERSTGDALAEARCAAAHVELRAWRSREALEYAEQAGGGPEAARLRGVAFARLERYAAARAAHEQALDHARRAGQAGLVARALIDLGATWLAEGVCDLADLYLEKALARAEEQDDPALLAEVYGRRGTLALLRLRPDDARALFERDLDRVRLLEVDAARALPLRNLGHAFRLCGKPAAARTALDEAVALFRAQDDPVNLALCELELALLDGDPSSDARIERASDALAGRGAALEARVDLARAIVAARAGRATEAELAFALVKSAWGGRGGDAPSAWLVEAYLRVGEAFATTGAGRDLAIAYLREGCIVARESKQPDGTRVLLARLDALDPATAPELAPPPERGGRVRTTPAGFDALVGSSRPMIELRAIAERAAETDVAVLIVGESGTGKELVATAIHCQGRRSARHPIVVNCAAFSESLIESELFGHVRGAFSGATSDRAGAFERAHGSTLFLDEIGELSSAVQAKLLRALEQGQIQKVGAVRPLDVDVRVIAATNRDVEQMVDAGEFRADLLHRLGKIVVRTVPLREHVEDLAEIASALLAKNPCFAERKVSSVSRAALDALSAYPFPGNVRELENVLIAAAMRCERGVILVEHLPDKIVRGPAVLAASAPGSASPPPIRPAAPVDLLQPGFSLDRLERELIELALRRAGGNKAAAARLLGITRRRLYSRLQSHDDD